jgi:hypothetical protein
VDRMGFVGMPAAYRLIDAVSRIVEHRTQGFGHLEAAERPDLMLESFLIDENKPYHKLLPARIIEIARARMADHWRRHPAVAKTKRRTVDRKAGPGRGTSFGDQSAYGSPGSGSTSRVPDHAAAPRR